MKKNNKLKRFLSGIMVAAISLSLIPTTFAAQSNEYVDPADRWVEANGRTNELDINATTTYETFFCPVCDMDTTSLVYRVPEYTKSEVSALNRDVMYSDGTKIGGEGTGNVDSGTPGEDAFYTGYHYTKAVCQNCGVMNSVNGTGCYSFGRNVYILNACDYNFFLDFDNTTYTPYNSKYHTTVLKKGKYCQFCKGTHARATKSQELHDFDEVVDAQLGNQRFHLTGTCDDCGYIKDEYAVAKSVVESYYGKVDGRAHTVTVSDLSEDGVNTSIRYGIKAGECDETSAPNYTDEGYYPVYYEITYSYDGTSMTENGVSYVWLLSDNSDETAAGSEVHTHDYRYIETVKPLCAELGYERWQCTGCGALEKRNYVQSSGHDYDSITIREASCQQGGYVLHMCKTCGDYYSETTSVTDHDYEKNTVSPTCTKVGYTEHICKDCGYKYLTDVTELASHEYTMNVTEPTCLAKGFTAYICKNCDDTYISDYTEPTGHEWDEGTTVTNSTCESEGVTEHHCLNCDEKMIIAQSAKGHTPGTAPTCTEAQTCEVCGAVLEMPTGHSYTSKVTEPSCTSSGYTTYDCDKCDYSYVADYTDKVKHNYNAEVTAPTCTEMGYTTYTCKDCSDSYVSDYTDKTAHNYNAAVTVPTCTEMGYTTYTCADCDESYVADYTEALGHSNSDWIIDVPATIEHSGGKHIECTVCKEVLKTEVIPQLTDIDNSDEDGTAKVGDYSIILTDKNGKPVFDSEITIDAQDNITIKLPEGRLLDYADRTTITVFMTDTQAPVKDLHIFIYDMNNNATTGITDANGQLTVLNSQTSTGNSNGTVGGADGDKTYTYVVTVTDKDSNIIPDCNIHIGEDGSLIVDLPDGVVPSVENPITVTVTNPAGDALADVSVTVTADNGYKESGITDADGKLTAPVTNKGYTDGNGCVAVNGYMVIVSRETGFIVKAFVVLENGKITVDLPTNVKFAYDNRITVTVLNRSDKTPVKDIQVTVNETVAIPEVTATPEATSTPEITEKPKSMTGITDSSGKVVFPPLDEDITDDKGGADITNPIPTENPETPGEVVNVLYNIIVENKDAVISDAFVKIENGKVYVTLPDTHTLTTSNQTTVTVLDKNMEPVKGVSVTVTDKNEKKATKTTNAKGQITVPVKSSGGGGGSSSGGGSSYSTVNIKVVDKNGKTIYPTKSVGIDKVTLTLPSGCSLVDNYYTITVTDRNGKAKADYEVVVKDKNNNISTGTTDNNGIVILPAAEHKAYVIGYPDGTFRADGYMTRAEAAAIFARLISEAKDESIRANASFDDISSRDWYYSYVAYLKKYDVIEGYEDDTFRPENKVTRAEFVAMAVRYYDITDDVDYSTTTSKYSDLSSGHWAAKDISYATSKDWLNGYADGSFKPDNSITRAEVVAVVNRVTGRIADEKYITKNYTKLNRFTDLKDNGFWAYGDIMEAANTHMAISGDDTENWVD